MTSCPPRSRCTGSIDWNASKEGNKPVLKHLDTSAVTVVRSGLSSSPLLIPSKNSSDWKLYVHSDWRHQSPRRRMFLSHKILRYSSPIFCVWDTSSCKLWRILHRSKMAANAEATLCDSTARLTNRKETPDRGTQKKQTNKRFHDRSDLHERWKF